MIDDNNDDANDGANGDDNDDRTSLLTMTESEEMPPANSEKTLINERLNGR